jgi:hypothetical protein
MRTDSSICLLEEAYICAESGTFSECVDPCINRLDGNTRKRQLVGTDLVWIEWLGKCLGLLPTEVVVSAEEAKPRVQRVNSEKKSDQGGGTPSGFNFGGGEILTGKVTGLFHSNRQGV